MRPYSFTPFGGSELVFPAITNFNHPQSFRSVELPMARASGVVDVLGDVSPRSQEDYGFTVMQNAATEAALDTAMDALRAAFAKRGVLKFAMADGSYRRTVGKLLTLHPRMEGGKTLVAPTDVRISAEPFLESDSLYNVVQNVSGPFTHTIGGNAECVRSLVLTITASAGLTTWSLTNNTTGYAFTYTNAVALTGGQSLVFDVGAHQAYIDTPANSVYGKVALGATQIALMKLAPGLNSFTASALPGGGQLSIRWRDTWH